MMTWNLDCKRAFVESVSLFWNVIEENLVHDKRDFVCCGTATKACECVLRFFDSHMFCLARWPIAPLLLDSRWLTELLSGTVGLTVCASKCSRVCMACRGSLLSPLALPFAPMFLFASVPLSDPLPLSPPSSPSSPRSLPRLLSRRLSLPLFRPRRPLPLSRNLSLPTSSSLQMNAPAAACGVNCHKACRSRLAVECRKRTKSISHETPPALQARSYSFPPPANTPPSLQNTGGSCFVKSIMRKSDGSFGQNACKMGCVICEAMLNWLQRGIFCKLKLLWHVWYGRL